MLEIIERVDGAGSRSERVMALIDECTESCVGLTEKAFLLWMYAEQEEVWKDDRKEGRRTREGFLAHMGNNEVAHLLLGVGAKTAMDKDLRCKTITDNWGVGWWEVKTPDHLKSRKGPGQGLLRSWELSKNLLEAIASASKVMSQEVAIREWEKRVEQRTSDREANSRSRKSPWVTATDIRETLKPAVELSSQEAMRPTQVRVSGDIEEVRMRWGPGVEEGIARLELEKARERAKKKEAKEAGKRKAMPSKVEEMRKRQRGPKTIDPASLSAVELQRFEEDLARERSVVVFVSEGLKPHLNIANISSQIRL